MRHHSAEFVVDASIFVHDPIQLWVLARREQSPIPEDREFSEGRVPAWAIIELNFLPVAEGLRMMESFMLNRDKYECNVGQIIWTWMSD